MNEVTIKNHSNGTGMGSVFYGDKLVGHWTYINCDFYPIQSLMRAFQTTGQSFVFARNPQKAMSQLVEEIMGGLES